jgi:hypothetical protein
MIGLALAFPAAAVAQQTNQEKASRSGVPGEKTIRGVIGGVTSAGETVVNLQTGRAESAGGTFLSVIGSEESGQRGEARQRENMYILELTPSSVVREATGRSREAVKKASGVSFEQLEIGDWVEAAFQWDDSTRTTTSANTKHGRHRVYYGKLISITVLPQPTNRGEAHGGEEGSASGARR